MFHKKNLKKTISKKNKNTFEVPGPKERERNNKTKKKNTWYNFYITSNRILHQNDRNNKTIYPIDIFFLTKKIL